MPFLAVVRRRPGAEPLPELLRPPDPDPDPVPPNGAFPWEARLPVALRMTILEASSWLQGMNTIPLPLHCWQ